MQIIRLFTGEDGESHFEDLTLDQLAELVSRSSGSPAELNRGPAKHFHDFHNPPRRQYVVQLAGEVENELADGTIRTLVPGDVLVVEDLTGHGHIARGVGTEPRWTVVIPIVPEP